MSNSLIVGGNSGIGLAIAANLINTNEHVYIVGRKEIDSASLPAETVALIDKKASLLKLDLNSQNFSLFEEIQDVDTLVITAGFGRVALIENLTESEIKNLIRVNLLAPIQIIKKYIGKLKSKEDFKCAVLVSIAGHLSSPYVAVYGAAKAALAAFIESVNAELAAEGYANRILDVSPGSIDGTAFNGGENDIPKLSNLAEEIVERMNNRETLYIPEYDKVYKGVIERYRSNPEQFGIESYNYKKISGRIKNEPQVVIGFLSGTFDLFHIGHLNLLRRAKEQCDYLIVSVHNSGAWKNKETFIPYEERKAIVASIKYVDEVVPDYLEDTDAWNDLHFHKLFVGSDYKGSERFNRYEEFFKDKNMEIVYFPYTTGTSSTQLRDALSKIK